MTHEADRVAGERSGQAGRVPEERSGGGVSRPSTSFDRMWADLDPVGRASSGGYRRFAWTVEDHTLREWFAGECESRGLNLVQDRMGNQWAWWGDPDKDGPGVVVGSHLDSVPDGGAYDGPLGVVSGLAALDSLRDRGFTPKRPIAVANFGDEEGARFGVACAGSRVITGAMTAERALGLTDADGITMAEALRRAGRDPDAIGPDPETLRRIGQFVELHVEQGRALADLDPTTSAVAVGTDIWPHGRWRIDLPGTANHAGTTALSDRRDAMLSAAQVVLAAREAAMTNECVATTGKIAVEPGGVNAIPSHVRLWLDARGGDQNAVRATVSAVEQAARNCGGTMTEESWTDTTRFDDDLSGRLRQILGEQTPMLGTGAGHDAGVLSTAGISTSMLFVRNPTGVSHSPEEFAERDDCLQGVEALTTVVQELSS